MRAARYLLVAVVAVVAAVVLGGLVLAILAISLLPQGRWSIAEELLLVESPSREAGSISFFVSVTNQVSDSVLRAAPIHYLRPFELQQREGDEWIAVTTVKKITRSEFGGRDGLRRSFCQFACRVNGGEYRALLIYRYRGRSDHLRHRLARRLPKQLSRWVLPNRADGAVWTEPFYLEPDVDSEGEERKSLDAATNPTANSTSGETFRRDEASSIRVKEIKSNGI